MAELCIVSEASVSEESELKQSELSVSVTIAEGGKCARCWKVLPEVTKEQDACNRCVDAVEAIAKAEAA